MASDRLEQYRKAQRVHIETQEGKPYTAFEVAATPQRRLDLRPGYDQQRTVAYGYLQDVIHAAGQMIGLMFTAPVLSVEIRGKHLQPLVDALREERVTIITEHIAKWHAQPVEGQPYIKTMTVTQAGRPRTAQTKPQDH